MNTADAALQRLRGEVVDIVLGTIFLFIGASACAIAAIRWRRGVRILVWLGIFSGMYGVQKLCNPPVVIAVLPHALKSAMPYVSTAVMYLLLVSALFAYAPRGHAFWNADRSGRKISFLRQTAIAG